MVGYLLIIIIGIVLMILSNLFFPEIKIKRFSLSTYWVIILITAILLLCFGYLDIEDFWDALTSNSTMNPLKILVLFLSMTALSIFLDEVGLFKYIAIKVSLKLQSSQLKLFIGFYFLISLLTVFTSNDIIILTFTPFICYFCKNAKINPLPYLISEFVAANTWSMFLIIGNPTNIYLASSFNINFFDYIKVMALPTIISSLCAFGILLLIFKKDLKEPMDVLDQEAILPNKFLMIVGIICLAITIILIAISSYIGLEMWYITLGFALLEFIICCFYAIKEYKTIYLLRNTIRRIPWNFVPFLLSMFVIVLSLTKQEFYSNIVSYLSENSKYYTFGLSGALVANIINNIPMSVLYTQLLSDYTGSNLILHLYQSIAASNIAAFITPMGALAGLMFMRLVKKNEVELSYLEFIKYGLIVGIPTLIICLSLLIPCANF